MLDQFHRVDFSIEPAAATATEVQSSSNVAITPQQLLPLTEQGDKNKINMRELLVTKFNMEDVRTTYTRSEQHSTFVCCVTHNVCVVFLVCS